jgi:integrase
MAELEGFPFAHCVKLMMLTGQRRGEVSGMRWSELDLDNAFGVFQSARVKNATSHIVPLAPLAIDILKIDPTVSKVDLVFTTTGRHRSLASVGLRNVLTRPLSMPRIGVFTTCAARWRPTWP